MSHGLRWWTATLAALLSAVAGLGVLALAVGAFLDPTSSYFATMSSSLWTTFGPHFLLVALVALFLAICGWRWGARTIGWLVMSIAGAAFVCAAFVVGSIMAAAMAAGGSVNPISGLFLGKMGLPPPDATEIVTDIDRQPLRAAIYLPSDRSRPAPVFAYIHGGGFMIGTNTETAADLRWFADRGWVVFSIDYRLFTDANPTWDEAPSDVACGLAWIDANAARFGGDSARLVLLGDSAGGNLAINLAYGIAQGAVQSSCGSLVLPAAVVVQYPAVDPVAVYERGYPVPGFEPQMLMRGYVGGTPDQYPDRVKAISSATYLSAKAPPTLIIEPERDGLVVSDSVYAFAELAKAAGVDIDLVRIPFANHVYNQIAQGSIGNQARLTITDHYLQQRGFGP